MTRRRAFTDEQCRELAAWFAKLRSMGSVKAKCRELGVSRVAFYDAIARGENRDTLGVRQKLSQADIEKLADEVSRGALHTDSEVA